MTSEVHLRTAGEAGLAHMIAGLIEANLAAHAERERLLARRRAAVQIDVTDTGVSVGLTFVPGAVTVSEGSLPAADLQVCGGAEDILALTTVPLRAGLPDPATPAGRALTGALLSGRLRVRGLLRGFGAMRMLLRLLTVT